MRKKLVLVVLVALMATPVLAGDADTPSLFEWLDDVVEWVFEMFEDPGENDPDFGPFIEPGG